MESTKKLSYQNLAHFTDLPLRYDHLSFILFKYHFSLHTVYV